MNTYLLGVAVAATYYLHAPIYLRLRHKWPRIAVTLARAEGVAEFIFLALVAESLLHRWGF